MKYFLAPLGIVVPLTAWWLVHSWSLDQETPSATQVGQATERVAVHVVPVQKRSIADDVELVGSLEPASQVQLRARVSGYITEIAFHVGDDVTHGDVVVKLDDARQKETVSRAQASLGVAEARVTAQEAKAEFTRSEFARQKSLAESGVSTAQQIEQLASELQVAEAELKLQQATLAQARADFEQVRLQMDELRITAPFDGFVASRAVDVGDLAQPESPLLTLVDLSSVRTAVHVVEKDYARVRPGQSATLRVDALPGQQFIGKVVRKAPVLDPRTRTALVEIEVHNPEFSLKPGMHARVRITFEKHRETNVIPIAALLADQNRSRVYVVTDGEQPETRLREVTTGITNGELVEVTEGLAPGERVVTLGNRMIRHGQLVNPVETVWPAEQLAEKSSLSHTASE